MTDRVTYQILLVQGVLIGLCLGLAGLILSKDPDTGALVAVAIVVSVCVFLVSVFTWGVLSIAAAEKLPSPKFSVVVSATFDRFGSFLGVASIFVIYAVGLIALVTMVAIVGLGAPPTAPISGMLTPLVLVVAGLGLLALVTMCRLAFAAVTLDNAGASSAIRKSRSLVRQKGPEVVLFLAADSALVVGLAALAGIVAIGAFAGVSEQWLFIVIGWLSDTSVPSDVVVPQAIETGTLIASAAVLLFEWVIVGTIFAFSQGSTVGFVASTAVATSQRSFCDQCGSVSPAGSAFCDGCGAKPVLV